MEEIKRYEPGKNSRGSAGMFAFEDGRYVLYTDVAALTERVRELEEIVKKGCQDETTVCPFLSERDTLRRELASIAKVVKMYPSNDLPIEDEIIIAIENSRRELWEAEKCIKIADENNADLRRQLADSQAARTELRGNLEASREREDKAHNDAFQSTMKVHALEWELAEAKEQAAEKEEGNG